MAVIILSRELANVVYIRLRAGWGDVVRFMDGAYVVYTKDQHHVDAPKTLNAYMDIRDIPRTLKALVRPVIIVPWRVRDDAALLRRVLDHEFEHAKSSLIKTLIFVSALSFSLTMYYGVLNIPVLNSLAFVIIGIIPLITSLLIE
ncbi:MAG: hypothetical protein RXO23_00005, partial [Vulcanisaeta sp.]